MRINRQNQTAPEKPQAQSAWRRGCTPWFGLGWILVFALFYFVIPWLFGVGQPMTVSYTYFRQQVEQGNVGEITVTGEEITGEFVRPILPEDAIPGEDQPAEFSSFRTYLPAFGDEALMPLLGERSVTINVQQPSQFPWFQILISFLPLILLGLLVYYFFSRMRSQGQNILSIGKSGAKLYERREERVTFDDVGGAKGVKSELREIVEYLKSPEKFERLGGEAPKGVLLVGPPGTGKTLLARAVAGEAEAPFFSITGSNFMEMFVGVGASRVRDLFSEAKKSAPSIIFIDELDSIGRRRGAGLGGGHDEREQTLNQMLSEMDGFEPNENVIVMAATNRPDILDQALLRPGRFDRRITIDMPTMHDRHAILKIHAQDKPLAGEIDLLRLARSTPGFSGADLANLLNEAALTAARRDRQQIEQADIELARDKVILGLERENLALTDEEYRLLAYHEGGHALIAALLPHADPVHKVTIVPRGNAMGVTQQLPKRDKYIFTREYLIERLVVMMGGRAAEELVFQTSTSGAENDLKQAADLARKMVLDWGMSERYKQIALGGRKEHVFLGSEIAEGRDYSDLTARDVDEEVNQILRQAYERATALLEDNRKHLDKLADLLLEREEVRGEEVTRIIEQQAEPQEV